MSKLADQHYLLTEQYRDATNINTRIQLHVRFSTNKYGWLHWVFDQLHLPPDCRILELGCGPGNLWQDNEHRIPKEWEITVSDFSQGMVQQAQHALEKSQHRFRFGIVDAQFLPFQDQGFDAVIANHMLYHVPNKPRALAEIRRVLKPDGRFYASTNGRAHLLELSQLLQKFNPHLDFWGGSPKSFALEDGQAQLSPWFSDIKLYRYADALVVTEPGPLVDYVLSGEIKMSDDARAEFTEFVEREMLARGGAIHITKDSGIFESFRGSTT